MVSALVLSIMIALGAAGYFGDMQNTSKGINPVQHSEGAAPPEQLANPGINPVQHSE